MKLLLIMFLVSLSVMPMFAQNTSKHNEIKEPIDVSLVSSISIVKMGGLTDSIRATWKYLTKEQIKSFATKWNIAKIKGKRKQIPEFKIVVYFINNTSRRFSVNGKYIIEHEHGDWGTDFKQKEYFDKLYEEAVLEGNQKSGM